MKPIKNILLAAMLLSGGLVGIFSCTDYQDEIDALDKRVYRLEHLVDSINEFVNKTSDEGLVIYHANLPIKTTKKHVTYGLENADVIAEDICVIEGETCFSVKINDERFEEDHKKICAICVICER